VAIYHWDLQTIKRSEGRSSVAAAAYRAAVRLEDDRTGQVYDYQRKRGVVLSALIGWTGSRQELWDAAEFSEKRKDSRVAREIEAAIPCELSPELAQALMLEYCEALRQRWGVAVDLNIHEPHSKGADKRNIHAHIQFTTRQVTENLFGAKTVVLDDTKFSGPEVEWARKEWENHANAALRSMGLNITIDCRSLKDKALASLKERMAEFQERLNHENLTDQERQERLELEREKMMEEVRSLTPKLHLGPTDTARERKGIATKSGTINRGVDAEQELKRLAVEEAAAKVREAEVLAEIQAVEQQARREAAAAAEKQKAEAIAQARKVRDSRIISARHMVAAYEAAEQAGPPVRRIWKLDDFVGADESSQRLGYLLDRRKDLAKQADGLRRNYPIACWFQQTVGRALNKKGRQFQAVTEEAAVYAKAERELRQVREALQVQLGPVLAKRQALTDTEFQKADELFTEAVNNLDDDLRKLAARQTTQEMQAVVSAPVVISTMLPVAATPPPKPRPTGAAPRPRW